ncbi:MAG: guanine deaminase [Anaerolineaceae bacterium]|nr:guanine deaminase [Anaerolineaceae bacterium]|tara:strand:+ start:3633 stop:5021 length:1389 start_codon:yes stop_codon:yes gene_type:complete
MVELDQSYANIKYGVAGTALHTPVRGEIEVLQDSLIVIDQAGLIESILTPTNAPYKKVKNDLKEHGKLLELSNTEYLLPGLIDLHIHAPQWPQMGKALHLPLYDWLHTCTFPLEAKYTDVTFAETVYRSLVNTLLSNGTTTAVYFGTIHLEATKLLADICLEHGQRALVGRVSMDNEEQCPDYYRDLSTAKSIEDTQEFIEYLRGQSGEAGIVLPAITPRFIPSCSDEALAGHGELAEKYNCHIQTHCSEDNWSHDYGISRFGKTDTQSLLDFGLITDKTILAHSNFINPSDIMTIKTAQSAIAHCPLSNFLFSNAVLPVKQLLDKGVQVGLGTDVSGGAHVSIYDSCVQAIVASRALQEGVNASLPPEDRGIANASINFMEAFWMATAGGGEALGFKVGIFSEGYCFDAMIIDTAATDSNLVLWEDMDSAEDILQKIVYNARRPNIRTVWVQGAIVANSNK